VLEKQQYKVTIAKVAIPRSLFANYHERLA